MTDSAGAAGGNSATGSSSDGIAVMVPWVANPFRGDKFEAAWLPAAEAALDFGASGWALFRSKEGGLDFTQWAFFDTKGEWEAYWYSDEIGDARMRASGLYQVPVLPVYFAISGMGSLSPAPTSQG